jgi:hypothetical protein
MAVKVSKYRGWRGGIGFSLCGEMNILQHKIRHMLIHPSAVILGMFCLFTLPADAQRVGRKGVTPATRPSKPLPAANYQPEQFAGRWQEVKRTNRAGEPVEIVDTFYIHVQQRNKVVTREGKNPYLTGALQVEPNDVLVAAADVFKIIQATDSSLVLYNQEQYNHHFQRVDRFSYESDRAALNDKPKEEYIPASRTSDQLVGRWWMYKRQAPPGTVDLNAAYIKSFHLYASTDSMAGKDWAMVAQAQRSEQQPARISVKGHHLRIESGKQVFTYWIYVSPEKELMIGDAGKEVFFFRWAER